MQKIKKFLFQNTTVRQTVAKNTFWLFFGEIIGRLLKIVIVVFATRKLGVEGWGIFSYSLAYVGFFYFLGDFGINTFLTREMSKNNSNKHKYLSTALILKIILLFIFFSASLLIGPNLGNIRLGLKMIVVFSTFCVSESLREFGISINRSLQKMEREGFSKILLSSLITILGIVLLSQNANPLSLITAYTIGSVISTFYIFWSIRSELKEIDWTFSKESLRVIYNFSWPLIIIAFFSFIFSIDSIMLGQMKSAVEVGLYSASVRLVQFSSIISSFIAISIFPILSKNEADVNRSALIFEKIMTIVIAIAIPITIGGIFFSQKLILLVLGPAYIAATPTLQILMVSILACFPDLIINNLIYSKNLQKIFLKTTSFGLAVNLVMNLFLIPRYGAMGAAISTTVAQLLIMSLNWRRLKKYVSFDIIPKTGKILISSLIMTLAIIILNLLGIYFIGVILVAVAVYGLSLYILKEPSFKEILLLITKHS